MRWWVSAGVVCCRPSGLGSSLRAYPGLPSRALTFRRSAAGAGSRQSIFATNSKRAGIVASLGSLTAKVAKKICEERE